MSIKGGNLMNYLVSRMSELAASTLKPTMSSSQDILEESGEPGGIKLEIAQNENVQSEFLKIQTSEEHKQQVKENDGETSGDEEQCTTKVKSRKKRKHADDMVLHTLTEEFLNVYYPISSCMSKHICVGISKPENFTPTVTLRQSAKKVRFCEKAWESFNKYLHLIECYLTNRVNGKKTNVVLDNSDIEVENIKMRGDQHVKFRDVTKHDEKITLSPDEFEMLVAVVPAINRYIKQLTLALPMIKDYLNDTLESNTPLLYGPIDTSIYNRLPQEVFVFRRMTAKRLKIEKEEQEQEECYSNCCYKQETSYIFAQGETNEPENQPLTQTS